MRSRGEEGESEDGLEEGDKHRPGISCNLISVKVVGSLC